MTVEELTVKFSANIDEFKGSMEELSKKLNDVTGASEKTERQANKAMKSPQGETRKFGKELSDLINKQLKTNNAVIQSKMKLEDMKSAYAQIQSKIAQNRAEYQKLINTIKELTSKQKDQEAFFNGFDGGIDGARRFRENLTKTLQTASADADRIRKKLDTLKSLGLPKNDASISSLEQQFEKLNTKIKRTQGHITEFDNNCQNVGIDPSKLHTNSFSTLAQQVGKAKSRLNSLDTENGKLGAQATSTANKISHQKTVLGGLGSKLSSTASKISSVSSKLKGTGKFGGLVAGLSVVYSGFSKALSGVKKLASGVGSLATKGFNKLKSAFKSGSSSSEKFTKSIAKGVSSIKKMGIAVIGMKIMKGTFGKLKSIISNYLSENDALNNRVQALKDSFGKALAPAINIVVSMMERLMPVILSITNAITKLLSSLNIGKALGSTSSSLNNVADATDKVAEAQSQLYGFDKITKVDDSGSKNSSSSTGNGSAVTENTGLSAFIQKLKSLWNAGDFEGIGEEIASNLNKVISKINNLDWAGIQSKIDGCISGICRAFNGFVYDFDWAGAGEVVGNGINTVVYALDTLLTTTDWEALGAGFASSINGLFNKVDWKAAGKTVADGLNAITDNIYGFVTTLDWGGIASDLADTINSFFKNTDFGKIGKTIGESLKGILKFISTALEEIDWSQLATDLEDLLKGVDWSGIASGLFEGLGAALGGLTAFLGKLIADAFTNIGDYFGSKINECGGNVVAGILKGISDAVLDIRTWIKDNIFQPFIDGFKKAFNIHSPSRDPDVLDLGKNIILGILNGITDAMSSIGSWIQENVLNKFSNAFNGIKDIYITLKGKFGDGFTSVRDNLKKMVNKNPLTTLKGKFGNGFKSVRTNLGNMKSKSPLITLKGKFGSGFKSARDNWNKLKSKTTTLTANIRDGITNGIRSILQSLCNMVNKVIGVLNKVLPRSMEISTISPPRLATGGVVTRATNAIVGENGAEAIMPLEKNTGWISKLAKQIYSHSNPNMNQATKQPINIPIYIGGKHITTVVIDDINKITKTSGNCPIKV